MYVESNGVKMDNLNLHVFKNIYDYMQCICLYMVRSE